MSKWQQHRPQDTWQWMLLAVVLAALDAVLFVCTWTLLKGLCT